MIEKTEEAIMANWSTKEIPLVSIRCITYNHEKYIADALDSFLMQETNFPFEIIIHDDASKDKTASIISEYQKAYPHIVKPIFEQENQYSKGNGIIDHIIAEHIKGKYVAVCEGDDYWTDESKLQRQFEAMERHPEVDICAHTVRRVSAKSGKVLGTISPKKKDEIIPADQVIAGGGGFVGTNSLFYREQLFEKAQPFRKQLNIDYTLQVQGALRGGMLFLSRCMSDYRVMTEGSWSARSANEDVANEIDARWDKMTEQLDVDTNGIYHDVIQRYMERGKVNQLLQFEHYDELKKYKSTYKKMEGDDKRRYFIKLHFPRTYVAVKKIWNRVRNG